MCVGLVGSSTVWHSMALCVHGAGPHGPHGAGKDDSNPLLRAECILASSLGLAFPVMGCAHLLGRMSAHSSPMACVCVPFQPRKRVLQPLFIPFSYPVPDWQRALSVSRCCIHKHMYNRKVKTACSTHCVLRVAKLVLRGTKVT